MSKKCVIEIWPTTQRVVSLGVDLDGRVMTHTVYADDLEELTTDYISKHFSDLQDDAYQRGLEDAWEAARKIVKMPDPPYWGVFDEYKDDLFRKITAAEAIEKLKAYEEKQKAEEEIKVGDEVISLRRNGEVIEDMSPWIVTYETKYAYQGFDACGMFHNNPKERVRKTGRHFDIASILKEMQS